MFSLPLQELFQGRAKQFDVENALLATSVRDFEKAISMVSFGFSSIEDFYAKSSTQGVVGNVKIPLLFIQVTFSKEFSASIFSFSFVCYVTYVWLIVN